MKRFSLLVILVLCFIFQSSALAEDSSENAIRAKAEELMDVLGIKEKLEKYIETSTVNSKDYGMAVIDSFKKKYPGLDEKYLKRMQSAYETYTEKIRASLSADELLQFWFEFYCSKFTEQDLTAMIAFYNSPIGQKHINESRDAEEQFKQDFYINMSKAMNMANVDFRNAIDVIFDEYYSKKYSMMAKDSDPDEDKLINTKLEKIQDEFGVMIHCGYVPIKLFSTQDDQTMPYDIHKEEYLVTGEDIMETLPAVIDFLSCYPKKLLRELLPDIALIKGRPDDRGMATNGLSYKGCNVIAIRAGARNYMAYLKTLHHELAHVLTDKFKIPFEADKDIKEIKEKYFKENDSLGELNQELYDYGYLSTYSLVTPADDFAVFAAYYWVKPKELERIAAGHQKIAVKLKQVKEFYAMILNEYAE